MVVLVAGQAHLEHGRDHLAADVDGGVDRRNGEVAALGTRAVAHVAVVIFLCGVGRQFDIVDREARTGIAVFEANVVEHEELGFGADIDRVAEAGRLEIGFGALGGGARVARIPVTSRRLDDVAIDDHHRRGAERIDPGFGQIGLEDHVALVDRLPAGDRRTVKHQPVFKLVLAHHAGDHGEVLPLALGIGEAQVHPLDFLVLDLLEDVFHFRHFLVPPGFIWAARHRGRRERLRDQIASSSVSPVRMRSALSIAVTKILPSPMRPVCAAAAIASTTRAA